MSRKIILIKQELLLLVYELNRSGLLAENEKIRPILAQLEKLLLVLFLVLWLKLVKDFLKVRCRLALLPFLISCLIWLDLVASLPLIKERILVIILLLHFLSLMLGSVLVLMLPLLVWLTPDLRIKKSLLKC